MVTRQFSQPFVGSALGFILCLLSLGALSSTVTGCSGKHVDENDPAALFQEAEDDIKNDHFQFAIEKLRIIKNKFPYSKYSIDAKLRIADVYFMQESYTEAALAYESFRDLHPKNEKVPYAMFRIGKAYFSDIPNTVARDLVPAQKALDAFQEFLKRFPSAPEAAEAKNLVNDIRRLLAEKELYVGNFYYRESQWTSAKARYAKIVDLYPETQSAIEAQEKLKKLSEKIK